MYTVMKFENVYRQPKQLPREIHVKLIMSEHVFYSPSVQGTL